ncbi:Phosphatidylinositol 3,4,5-trisphosphate 5-phosphatase [Actinidia chinensis var. chinensis]|uniref:Phosphatidylinositol 3,4,5-trisphosphate 5-phosphatase n=1 Tax=Actinidia chinensis var. chinensis TaxID=1590841 RepID=A0A2R6Q4U7_ACTCC|nr:Phosphatidylinositol 3,4,5-trisphosphate 5-phosphatase [Actinidia chinensis var. chinensis]
MKGSTSRVIMGATLVMVGTLAIVLGLILVLLFELYCSLLLRRRRLPTTTSNPTATATPNNSSSHPHQPQPLQSFYAQGVLQAPRTFLFPQVGNKEANKLDIEKQHSQPHQEPNSFISVSSPKPMEKVQLQDGSIANGCGGEGFVYISNPIYHGTGEEDTPFETPDSSPSRLEIGGSYSSSDDDEGKEQYSLPNTPPLTPMKELPAEACSVSLRDTRSLATSGSDSNSKIGLSSSSSGSPCTSPSW